MLLNCLSTCAYNQSFLSDRFSLFCSFDLGSLSLFHFRFAFCFFFLSFCLFNIFLFWLRSLRIIKRKTIFFLLFLRFFFFGLKLVQSQKSGNSCTARCHLSLLLSDFGLRYALDSCWVLFRPGSAYFFFSWLLWLVFGGSGCATLNSLIVGVA